MRRKRPSQSSQGYHLLFFRFAQDVAHTDEGYMPYVGINVPEPSFSLAGFQVTLIGRFWVTPEVMSSMLSGRRSRRLSNR